MTDLTKLLRLRPEDLNSKAVCTGEQLARILAAVEAVIGELQWHFTDVEPLERSDDFPPASSPTFVGDTRELKKRVERTSQFVSGVFLGSFPGQHLRPGAEWSTEDDPFRGLQGAQVEIRAFDTSYFDLYADDDELLSELKEKLGGTIVRPT